MQVLNIKHFTIPPLFQTPQENNFLFRHDPSLCVSYAALSTSLNTSPPSMTTSGQIETPECTVTESFTTTRGPMTVLFSRTQWSPMLVPLSTIEPETAVCAPILTSLYTIPESTDVS